MSRSATALLCLVALCLYGASLLFPAFTCPHTKSFEGYAVLAIGYMGLVGLDPRWLANIGFVLLLLASLKSPVRTRPAIAAGTALLAVASFAQAAGCEGAGGAPEVSTGLALGGQLWVGSLLLACVANLSLRWSSSPTEPFEDTRPEQNA